MQIHIGCSGWFYWHWRDDFYADLPTNRWFNHYEKHFPTVELNAPFYRWPLPSTIKCWRRQSKRRGFRYCIKVNQIITHEKRLVGTKKLIREFYTIADVLEEKMGCFLFQFPPSFKYSPGRLKRIVNQLDHTRRNVVEFRHKSWWNAIVYRALRKTGTIFCTISAPRLPDDLIKTSDTLYLRFHGTQRWYRYDYSREELTEWADKIRATRAKEVWIYFNNDREGFSIKNARALIRLLSRSTGLQPVQHGLKTHATSQRKQRPT